MTEERTLTDIVPGGGTVEMSVTAVATNLEIEEAVLSAGRFHADAVHTRLATQFASWRAALYEMRAELGGAPAPEPHPSSLAPCPMPGRMRCWTAPDGLWVMYVGPGRPLDLDQAEMVRVPVSATDTDADLEASAEKWLTGYGCPPAGSVEFVLPQLIAHRDRLAEEVQRFGKARSPRPMAAEEARPDDAVVEAQERAATPVREGRAQRLTTLVLYVSDVEASAAWYRSALGVVWTREQHDGGPDHVSARSRDVLLELYPRGGRHQSRVRIELAVPDAFGDAYQAPDGFPRRMEDPDGNVVVVNVS